MYKHVRKTGVGKKVWVSVVRRDAAGIVTLCHPIRWRALVRVWNVGLPCGVWGRETPF